MLIDKASIKTMKNASQCYAQRRAKLNSIQLVLNIFKLIRFKIWRKRKVYSILFSYLNYYGLSIILNPKDTIHLSRLFYCVFIIKEQMYSIRDHWREWSIDNKETPY